MKRKTQRRAYMAFADRAMMHAVKGADGAKIEIEFEDWSIKNAVDGAALAVIKDALAEAVEEATADVTRVVVGSCIFSHERKTKR